MDAERVRLTQALDQVAEPQPGSPDYDCMMGLLDIYEEHCQCPLQTASTPASI